MVSRDRVEPNTGMTIPSTGDCGKTEVSGVWPDVPPPIRRSILL